LAPRHASGPSALASSALPPVLDSDSRDARVMHTEIETPAIAGVSVADLSAGSSSQRSLGRQIWLNHAVSCRSAIARKAPKAVLVMHR
jgi:hypothetical protein